MTLVAVGRALSDDGLDDAVVVVDVGVVGGSDGSTAGWLDDGGVVTDLSAESAELQPETGSASVMSAVGN